MNNIPNESEHSFKFGIMLIVVLLIALLVIFGAYFFRSRQDSSNNGSAQKDSFFERIFNNSDNETQTGNSEELKDPDNDGLTNREELLVYKTDPNSADSDGDGLNDKAELSARRDPLNPNPAAEWPPRPTNFSAAGQ